MSITNLNKNIHNNNIGQRGGLVDDPYYPKNHCRVVGHNPPNMMVIPAGKIYIHVCPGCGYRVTLRANHG